MPHKHAAIKARRQTKERTERNAAVKKTISYLKKQAQKAARAKDIAKAESFTAQLIKAVDKAAQRKIIKKNTAARRKSRLIKSLQAAK